MQAQDQLNSFLSVLRDNPRDMAFKMRFADWLLQRSDPALRSRGMAMKIEVDDNARELNYGVPLDPIAARAGIDGTGRANWQIFSELRRESRLQWLGALSDIPGVEIGGPTRLYLEMDYPEDDRTDIDDWRIDFKEVVNNSLVDAVATGIAPWIIELDLALNDETFFEPLKHLSPAILRLSAQYLENYSGSIIESLLDSPNVSHLRELGFSGFRVGVKELELICHARDFKHLSALFLPYRIEIGCDVAKILAASTVLQDLTALSIASSVTAEGVGALSRSSQVPQLEVLNLSHVGLGLPKVIELSKWHACEWRLKTAAPGGSYLAP